jgi:glycosyltransferase involved in cell wall biosynthesis
MSGSEEVLESVSVVIPTYNRAHLIGRAVASALAAMQPGDELIVVDDGSTDDTETALAPFLPRIRYFKTPNRGVGPARNYGVGQARHPLVAFLDSDDEWMPDSLELRRRLMAARPDLVFCFTDFTNKSEDGHLIPNYLVNWHEDTRDWNEILGQSVQFSELATLPAECSDFRVHIGDMYPVLLERSYVPAWTALVRRSLCGDDFQFAEDLPLGEEWLMFGKISRRGPVAYLNRDTAWNHGHTGPRVSSEAGLIGLLTGHLTLAQRIWGTDEAFLEHNRARYLEVIALVRLKRARWYLSRGYAREGRAEVAAARAFASLSLKLLATAPAPLLYVAGRLRRILMERRSK